MLSTVENQEGRLFQRDSIPILVSRRVKIRKFKLLYFRNETCYGNGNLYKDLLFVYLQPSINKNSYNLAILTLEFDDVTVKTMIYRVFSLTWPAYMQIYCNKRMRLDKKRVQLPEDWFGTPTWPPFHCFGTPIWPSWRHVKTLYRRRWSKFRIQKDSYQLRSLVHEV